MSEEPNNQPEQKEEAGQTEWRQVTIETNGNDIKIVKNEVTMLELRQILALILQEMSKPK